MYDAIIIGAGHNGLVCAAYLAKAGRKVLVLEANDRVGGAAITRSFGTGFKVSAGAHLINLLDAVVIDELKLKSHGLDLGQKTLKTVSLSHKGQHLVIDGDQLTGQVSDEVRSAFADYKAQMTRFSRLLNKLHLRPPPRLKPGRLSDYVDLLRVGAGLRRLGQRDMRDFLRIAGINIYDVLEEHFDNELLKGALAFDAVLGNHLGPRSNGSVLNALHRSSGRINDDNGTFVSPPGGVGAVSEALAKAAVALGAEIRTGAPVAQLMFNGDTACGVRLQSGEQIEAETVVSNADPKRTFLDLVGARHLEAEFAQSIHRTRCSGNVAKLHLGLKSLPRFTELDPTLAGERLLIAPSADYVDLAFNQAKYGHCSDHPAIEITIPSVADPSLADEGHHVLSAIVQYAPYQLKGGWEHAHEPFKKTLIDQLDQYAPGLSSQVISSELLTPADIEAEFGITGGHWHHGEMTLDQAFMLRPAPGAGRYATPIDGLYLCGAGSHPGGGVMGLAGRNAAQSVLSGGKT